MDCLGRLAEIEVHDQIGQWRIECFVHKNFAANGASHGILPTLSGYRQLPRKPGRLQHEISDGRLGLVDLYSSVSP